MTAPTINGTRYPQPIEDLLPAARALPLPDGEAFPSRNRLMREFRIGAPKAGELLALLKTEPAAPPADTTEPDATDPADPPAVPEPAPLAEPDPTPAPEITPAEPPAEASAVSRPDTPAPTAPARRAVAWPVVLLALPAFVAIWSGWVGLGGLTGFGIVHPLPGIWDRFSINSAITLPIGVETYGAYALYVWLSGRVPAPALRFAKWSALGSLAVGALGQVAYHLLVAAGVTSAPWWITTAVACLPVAVLGMGAALAHLVRTHD
ncbi:ABC transporter permease [Micromonospora sp. WMMA1998]|uniref:ABC transporter permease n=1 Tax=Micromonospora sp. WMMA1998 TaxID=3015167 RepID=UPI00248C52D7|nr:ABC transporter permease [Micromonospora sp. WMMA1998]WBC17735.1 ABC transporter permease [Micromonospora sp. WMMA1998]